MSKFKPGVGFFAMVEQTSRLDLERRIRREFKERGAMVLRQDQDMMEQMDAGLKVSKEMDLDAFCVDGHMPDGYGELGGPYLKPEAPVCLDGYASMAFGCTCNRPFYACDCGAAVEQERREG